MSSFFSKTIYAPLISILALVLITACANPTMESPQMQSNMGTNGTLDITLSTSEDARSVTPGDYEELIESYEILLSGIQGMGPISILEPAVLLETLPLGEYTISVSALDADGNILSVGGAGNVEVFADITAAVAITMIPVMGGEGNIAIEYDWESASLPDSHIDKAIATLTPIGASPISIDVTVTANGLEFSGTFPSGEYVIACELFSNGNLISSIAETIQIFDGLDTVSAISFGSEAFNTAPEPPSSPRSGQSGLSVNLSWTDSSDLETGYNIYRSANGEDFVLASSRIPANSVSWTDTPIVPGTEYTYRIAALNDFGESEYREVSIVVDPPILGPVEAEARVIDLVLGDSGNLIPVDLLLDGFNNTFNRSDLEILSVFINGEEVVARLDNGNVVVDASALPYESEGEELILEYTVHIAGEPINETYSSTGSARLRLVAPEVEEIIEEDLLPPVQGFIYDNRNDMERKMRLYEPPEPQEIFDTWGRLSNHMYYRNGDDAESSVNRKGDEADMALLWKLKQDSDGSYVEYARNSVYAGFVSPDGEESENFTLEATVSSKDDDDDTVGLIVAFLRDGDSNYVLEAARSQGSTSGDDYVEPRQGWGLIVRKLSAGDDKPEIGEVLWSRQLNVGGTKSDGWKNSRTRIKATRNGETVTISATDWDDEGNYVPGSVISVNLRSERVLSRFLGAQKFGYFTASQERTSFRDIELNGGVIQDKLFFLDPDTGESEVWWYEKNSKRWILMAGTEIQGVLGYPLEITNPETGETYLIERKGYRRGRWQDWWDRWNQWDRFNSGKSENNRFRRDRGEDGDR